MTFSELQAFIAGLIADPNHDRYALTDINTELDNTQGQWNAEIKVISATTTLTTVSGTRQYNIYSGLVGTPISFPRVTHKGIDLKKRSKSYFDLYTSSDWTQQIGTPTDFYIEAQAPVGALGLYLTVFPTPQGGDAGANLVVEYCRTHDVLVNSTDVPFTSGGYSNYLLRPYDFYLGYSAAARLLARDPSAINVPKQGQYMEIAREGKELIINVFKQLEADEPLRIRGGRQWVY